MSISLLIDLLGVWYVKLGIRIHKLAKDIYTYMSWDINGFKDFFVEVTHVSSIFVVLIQIVWYVCELPIAWPVRNYAGQVILPIFHGLSMGLPMKVYTVY